MTKSLPWFFLVLFTLSLPLSAPAADSSAPKKHPLRGEVTAVLPERKMLLVKHEEIPGVMRAMTMGFVVEERVLAELKPGAKITGLMWRNGNQWRLDEVKIVESPKPTK